MAITYISLQLVAVEHFACSLNSVTVVDDTLNAICYLLRESRCDLIASDTPRDMLIFNSFLRASFR